MLLIEYPKCSTCRKAKAFLQDRGAAFESRHIVDNPPTADELDAWQRMSGLPLTRFFNTSGQVYRRLGLKEALPAMDRQQQLALLATARRAEGLSDVQMRRCSARTWNYAPGEKVAVYGYTNAAEGELFLNGASQGVRRMADFPDLGFLVWEVDFEPGVLELVAGDARETLETTGAACAIQVQPWQAGLAADGEDVAQIELAAVDAQGRPVWQDATLLSVAVEGPAVLLGLENGDLADVTAYTQPARRAYHGRAIAYLRSTGSKGVVRVRVEGEGLRPCEVALDAQ